MNESLRFLTELEKLRKAATNGGDWHLDESHCHGAMLNQEPAYGAAR